MQCSTVQIKLCAHTTQSIFSHKITKCHKTEEFHISIPIALLLSFLLLLLWLSHKTESVFYSIPSRCCHSVVVYGMSLPGLLHERHAMHENDEEIIIKKKKEHNHFEWGKPTDGPYFSNTFIPF